LGQLEVELAATAEFEEEQAQAPPEQEALVVDDAVLVARVVDVIEAVVEVGPEVSESADQERSDVQDRPFFRF
jgi:hypothetical protein